MGRTPAEQKQLEEITEALKLYEDESREFKREVQLLVEKKYEEKRNTLANSYEKAIRDLEVLERKERLDAIAQFEEFLLRYPNDPKYTPDVMFRLAELYYERSSDDHIIAMRDYEERLKKLDPEKNPTPPPEPKVDFAKSIALYKRLIADFPTYRLNDASYYLLGYCEEKQEQFAESRVAYQALIASYPKSKFATEAWVRIGEYFFDAYNEENALEKAADAYEHAVEDKTHALYDKALYKLGWTYYRMDRFDDAVGRFLALIDFYGDEAKKKGDDAVGGDLRAEAIQYTAVSFVDEKWGSLAKAQEVFKKVGGKAYEAEIYRRMGDIYFDQTKHNEAIEAYRLVLAKDPLNKEAPQIQQKIVQAYERDRKLEEAFAESSKLGNMFGPGTPWNEKWKRDPDVVASATEMAEKSLYSTAVYHHQQALVFKQEGKYEQARATFQTAAMAYDTYLKRFPRSKNAYEMEFYLAECLYNSFQFQEAAKHYAAVRDSSQDVKYQADASFSAVLAWQKQVELDNKEKKCVELKVLKSTERGEEKPQLLTMCDSVKSLIAASDQYVAKAKAGDDKAPAIAYKNAELFYVHNDFDEARRRFAEIVKKYPKNEVAKYAVNLTVETYLIDKNWAMVEKTSEELSKLTDVIDAKSDLAKDLQKFKLAGRFKLADELMAKGDYENAAKKYIALVDEAPKHEFADKALNNAAVCFENSRRFDSALRLYERIFRDYPSSKLADAALFRVAVNAENSYDFDKAVDNYQKLVKDYPASKDRENALFNTARLLEGLQKYDQAASAYLRYVDLYPKSEDAPKTQFKAALIYEKQGDYAKEITALNEFVTRYQKDPKQADFTIDAKKRIGDCLHKQNKDVDARKAYAAAADEFDKRKLQPDTAPIAANAAAEARFLLAEAQFADFDKLKIGGSGKALTNAFKVKKDATKKVQDAYAEVFKYKRLEWTLAALYRRGFILERFAQTIVETPVPPEIKRYGDEAVVAYQDLLAQQTVALEDKAVENYIATLAEAKKAFISNEWTKKTLESLNRFRPKEYPVLKDPKGIISGEGQFTAGVILTPEGNPKPGEQAQKLKGDEK
ncbi:MAG: tetratricopeptide repeat protein [Archangiaceae bacterium]|nr:tetratricopeptide repeat protein [Archangiaceae bacterium]